jgi:predicted RNase H-like HicB family nuclease
MAPNKKATLDDLPYYMGLPWTYTVETTKETGTLLYIVYVNELPGICTDAPSLDEAFDSIKEALAGVLELYIKMGDEIPLPKFSS